MNFAAVSYELQLAATGILHHSLMLHICCISAEWSAAIAISVQ
jgi:hypothetical protein